jgi:hypothetical protein
MGFSPIDRISLQTRRAARFEKRVTKLDRYRIRWVKDKMSIYRPVA